LDRRALRLDDDHAGTPRVTAAHRIGIDGDGRIVGPALSLGLDLSSS
jgi:hypothetical protein